MIPEVPERNQVLTRISRAVHESDGDMYLEMMEERLIGHLELHESHQFQAHKDDCLVGLVARWGVKRVLRQSLQTRVGPDPDYSVTLRHYIRVSRAAFSVRQAEEARRLLLECLELINRNWDWDRRSFLIEIANLLLQAGYENDLFRVIDLASGIGLEQERTLALAELALVCSDASDDALKKHSLEMAVSQIEDVEHRSHFQHVLSKISLAMSKIGDGRANAFVREAIQLAERPTQLAWHWQEQDAWVKIAHSLVSEGLCDETLGLIKRLDLERRGVDQIPVELALQGRWDDAWNLVQDLNPILKRRALFGLAKHLDSCDDRYDAIVTEIERCLGQSGRPQDQAEVLAQLTSLSLSVQDEVAARGYLYRLVNVLDDVLGQLGVNLLIRAAGRAVELSDNKLLHQLVDRARALPEDTHLSRSTAMIAVCHALAKLGEITYAWVLAEDIIDDGKRLEAYVRICESAHLHGQTIDGCFNKVRLFARRINNTGWVPTFWGALALLAHQLGHSAKRECIDRATRGARDPAAHIAFRAYNSANVAEYLHQIGLLAQALGLLEYGLACADRVDTGFGIDPLRKLVQVVVSTKMTSLWPRVIQVAQAIEEPVLRANALLGVTHAIARLGNWGSAAENLPLILAAVQDAVRDEAAIIEFGTALDKLLQPDSEVLDTLIANAFEYARMQDRPTVLTWIAVLLPVFAKADSRLAVATWRKTELVETMLKQ